MMLIIAVGHGPTTDPYTTSILTRSDTSMPEPINPSDAKACRDFICQKKDLRPEWVDEILVVYLPEYDADPEVIHHYTQFD